MLVEDQAILQAILPLARLGGVFGRAGRCNRPCRPAGADAKDAFRKTKQ